MRELPTGTVTFLFTDIEGSTRLLDEHGAERYAEALAEHRLVLREAFQRHGGIEVDTQGDAFFVAFPTAPGALEAAREAQEALQIPVRMGLHTGTPFLTEEGYVGADVHRAARIAAAGHGRQVLVSSSTATLLEPSNSLLLDLGEHRLKDLSAPERIYQLGEGEFPRLKTLYQTNLPVPATPFLGREKELARASELLLGGVRLLTLSGPGGTGKTRLALQAAGAAADGYPDGVWWVPLAPLADPALVLLTAGKALGAEGEIQGEIADKRLLLLLDNFEHLIEAAGPVAALLGACPNLTILVTSRERLQLAGEHEYAVPAMAPSDGLALFAARARALGTEVEGDKAALELCERLDNLPLALELAAARTKLFSPEQLLERLGQRLDLFKGGRDADPRQRTLRATIEWSYDLLTPEEQRLFARLSVFAGGCTYDAAEEICDGDENTLQSLLDKSLLRRRDGPAGKTRYWMLETIRQFAGERLEKNGDNDALRDVHAEYYLGLALARAPIGTHFAGAAVLEALASDLDNLRVSRETLHRGARLTEELLLATALAPLYQTRGPISEGSAWLEGAVETGAASADLNAEARLSAAALARVEGRLNDARAHAEAALALFEATAKHERLPYAVRALAVIAAAAGDASSAQIMLEEALRQFRELRDAQGSALVAADLSDFALVDGDFALAVKLAEDAEPALVELDHVPGLASVHLNAGSAYAELGRPLEAERRLDQAFDDFRTLGDQDGLAITLDGFAAIAAHRQDYFGAARLLGRADALLVKAGVPRTGYEASRRERLERVIRAELGDSCWAAELNAGADVDLESARASINSLS